MATPVVLRIVNPQAPGDRQQAVVVPTKEARLYREKRKAFPTPPVELLSKATAMAKAEKLLRAKGTHKPSRQQCLGKLVLPFGQYIHAPFHWLVENDVGYITFLLDRHKGEVEDPHRKGEVGNRWVKDLLAEYAESFPQVSCLLEANVDRWIYGQKGFENSTFAEMWELYRQFQSQKDSPEKSSGVQRERVAAAHRSVRKWLRLPVTDITSVQLKRFRTYIMDKYSSAEQTSTLDSSSWPGDDAELVAASQAVEEDMIKKRPKATAYRPGGTAVGLEAAALLPDVSVQPETTAATRPAAAAAAAAARPAAKKHTSGYKTSAGHPRKTKVTPVRPEDVATAAAVQPAPAVQPASAAVKANKQTSRHKTSASHHPKTPEVTPVQPAAPVDPDMSPSTSTACDLPMASHPSDAEVDLEGWVRLWENPGGIPSADISWLKEDTERGLFTPIQTYKDIKGQIKRRRVMKSDRMWFYPPEPPGFVGGGLPTPQLFFRSWVFVWRPVGVWRYSLKCPRGENCVGSGRNVHLSKSGFHSKVRLICDVSGWYTVITEVLSCGPCTKAARSKESVSVGRWLAWDNAILSQLSEAHQAIFPAVLTTMRGVDRNVVHLLRDRTEGNTMEKVWRQVQENHVEEYLHRKDLYTTLLMSIAAPGGIVSAMRQTFQAPPAQKQLPTARLLRHAFLLAEANNVQDYRSQIFSTFGTVMKMDSTKNMVKKLSGQGRGSAEWFTSIGNKYSQIVTFVLTWPYRRGDNVPGVVRRWYGCAPGHLSLDPPDAAIRTDAHSKYAMFKSALAGAVLAYNRTDLELLIEAVRAKDPDTFRSVSEQDVVRLYVTRDQLQHHVRRVTLGAQQTFRLIHLAIEELKGPAGLDQSGVKNTCSH
ncbi:uncharacterized protein LOC117542365 [Gymnodraco acuticeps]|uniref:Uncharacterized protein LOC117542365 n=1 Tax=Gymnodraco acuticeps TaxID=8218 RepID=A0A6P8TNZ9_GYMAC|nr:uncharacterized protein LOC117542365 [Gymnodraco acuticeps]